MAKKLLCRVNRIEEEIGAGKMKTEKGWQK